jgi:putative membrane protein
MDQSFENGVYYSPGKRVFRYFVLAKLLFVIILFIVLGIGASFLQGFGAILPVVIIAGILLCGIVFIIGWVKYKSVKFMFDEFSFHVEKGIFSKSEIAIPYRQIQDVNHEQSFSEKMWGIARIAIQSAGTDESGSNAKSEGILPVLDTALAISLEKELLQRAGGK